MRKENIKKTEDLTGLDRMPWNVVVSWLGHMVFIISGFIMPRLIDGYIGAASLGIWDFCWSFVNYLSLAGLGFGSSVNRYVAKYRMQKSTENLNIAVSSVALMQLTVSIITFLITFLIVVLLPVFIAERLGEDLSKTQWVIGLLGSSVGIHFLFEQYRGVVTGCHRWDLHNTITSGAQILTVVAMAGCLIMGGGLISLAIVTLLFSVTADIARMIVAYNICEGLKLSIKMVRWYQIKNMAKYGGKNIVVSMPSLVLLQTTSILIVGSLGAAMLAIFARPVALVRHVQNLSNKFAFVLTPTAGSLHEADKKEELRSLFFESTKFGVAFTMPMLIVLGVYGDVLIDLWMGPDYVNSALIIVISLGFFLPLSQNSILKLLGGMNAHGRIAMLNMQLTFVVYGAGIVYVNMVGWSLLNAALLLSVSMSVGYGVLVPILACREIKVSLFEYLRKVFFRPLLIGAIYFGLVYSLKHYVLSGGLPALLGVLFVSGMVLITLYWFVLVDRNQKAKLLSMVGFGPKIIKQ